MMKLGASGWLSFSGTIAGVLLALSVFAACGDSDEHALNPEAGGSDAGRDSRVPPGNDAAPSDDGSRDAGSDAPPNEAATDAGTDVGSGDAAADADGSSPSDVAGTAGGTVGDPGGTITLIIPPGALAGDTRFTFTGLPSLPGLSSDYVLTDGTAFRIDWTGAGFTENALVTIRISPPLPLIDDPDYLYQAAPTGVAVVECDGPAEVIPAPGSGRNAYETEAGGFRCQLADGGLSQSASVGLVTAGPTITTPSITAQPANLSVGACGQAIFRVTATGGDLRYQWRRNGVAIPSATGAAYGFEPTVSDNGARFSVQVMNLRGSLTSSEALLTVGPATPPAAPVWSTSRELAPFGTGIDLPQVGFGGSTAWMNGSLLQADGHPQLASLAVPTRTRPIVISGPNRPSTYIVFVDDDGTSSCSFGGNRLSVIAARIGSEGEVFPLSPRFTLYPSTDCISQFAAGYATDPTGSTPLVFAVKEQSSGQLKMGTGGPFVQSNDPDAGPSNWVNRTGPVAALNVDAACSGSPHLTADGMTGILQSSRTGGVYSTTTAVLAWVADNANLCAATLDNGVWSLGTRVFDNAVDTEPTVAIDGASGSVLVLGSRLDPAQPTPTYRMTAAFRAPGGAWQLDSLDSSEGVALPNAAFTSSGDAFVVWRPNLATPPTTVYVSRRPRNGSWEPAQPISSPTAADTRFPRVCTDNTGSALVLYSERSGTESFKVWSRLGKCGAWSTPSLVQDGTNEGRFAECRRYGNVEFHLGGLFAAWRETDPADPTKFRIMAKR